MALIFCESFEDSRSVGGATVSELPDLWEFVSGAGYSFAAGNTGRSGYSAAKLNTTSADATKLKLSLDVLGAQSGKTLYLGVGVNYLQSAPGTKGTTLPNRFMTFFNAAGDEVLQISVKKEAAADTAMRIVIGQAGTVFAEYALTDLTFSDTTESSSPYIYIGDWVYLEFKIDLVANKFTLRANGIPKFVVSTSSAESTYTTQISEITAIQFHGSPNNASNVDVHIDDFYLADNTGPAVNSWVGPCRILQPVFVSSNFATSEVWDPAKIGSWSSDLASNDGDSSFISSGTVDKKQLVGFRAAALGNGAAISLNEGEYVAAVQLNTVLRKTNLDSAVKPIYKSAANTYHDLDSAVTIGEDFLNYRSQIFVFDQNPATNTTWNLNEVMGETNNIGFGLQIVEPA